jgi:D-glycero-alpha-D-manno-heptose 1-phosphate guanylyltransferase
MENTVAIILVGGFGTRIRHLTGPVPKPLVTVNQEPFLCWILQNLKRQSIRSVYLLSHFRADLIEQFALSVSTRSLSIQCIKESTPSGTGGSILDFISANSSLAKNYLVLNGDSLLIDFNLNLAKAKIAKGCSGVIFGVPMNDASRYGTLNFDHSDELITFEEKKSGSGVINTGVYLFKREIFSMVNLFKRPISLERELIPAMINNGAKIQIINEQRPFIDIGTEDSLSEASAFVSKNFRPKK